MTHYETAQSIILKAIQHYNGKIWPHDNFDKELIAGCPCDIKTSPYRFRIFKKAVKDYKFKHGNQHKKSDFDIKEKNLTDLERIMRGD